MVCMHGEYLYPTRQEQVRGNVVFCFLEEWADCILDFFCGGFFFDKVGALCLGLHCAQRRRMDVLTQMSSRDKGAE